MPSLGVGPFGFLLIPQEGSPMKIDLNFRPESYADFDDPVSLALNGIKGQMRREMARDMLTAEGERRAAYDAVLGPIESDILGEQAPAGFTHNLNHAFGPSWMGGEYLPDFKAREIEIARIVLASVTMDVFSIRARLRSGRYHYSIKDEYETDFTVTPKTSRAPLMLSALIGLIDTADGHELESNGRSLVDVWWWQQWESPLPLASGVHRLRLGRVGAVPPARRLLRGAGATVADRAGAGMGRAERGG